MPVNGFLYDHYAYFLLIFYCSFLLGIGIGAEYPCGSVAASEQSEEEGVAKNAQHRWFALATSESLLRYPHIWCWFHHELTTVQTP